MDFKDRFFTVSVSIGLESGFWVFTFVIPIVFSGVSLGFTFVTSCWFTSVNRSFPEGFTDLYTSPCPLMIQSGFRSGKRSSIREINSKFGLFLPANKCDILDGCTSIISANFTLVSPSNLRNWANRLAHLQIYYSSGDSLLTSVNFFISLANELLRTTKHRII